MGDQDLGLRYWGRQRVTRRRVLSGRLPAARALGALRACRLQERQARTTATAETASSVHANVNDGYQDGRGQARRHPSRATGRRAPDHERVWPGHLRAGAGPDARIHDVRPHVVRPDRHRQDRTLPRDEARAAAIRLRSSRRSARRRSTTKIPSTDAPLMQRTSCSRSSGSARQVASASTSSRTSWTTSSRSDDRTVKITMKFPWAWVFTSSNAGSPLNCSILPKEILHDYDDLLQQGRDRLGPLDPPEPRERHEPQVPQVRQLPHVPERPRHHGPAVHERRRLRLHHRRQRRRWPHSRRAKSTRRDSRAASRWKTRSPSLATRFAPAATSPATT